MAFGIASAVGSLGQFAMLPISMGLISVLDWAGALMVLAALAAVMALFSSVVSESGEAGADVDGITAGEALREAVGHRGFWLLSLGFFVCGFQVVFIAIHLPTFLLDQGLSVKVGATVLALIGLLNILGTYVAGYLGGKYRKPYLLSMIYAARAVVIALFVFTPLTVVSAYLFGVAMGLLWLSTVPLTNGVVAGIFGVRNLAMLGGVVFLFHQIGAFLGGWLGGYVFDRSGSYDTVWIIAIGLSVMAAILNLPVRERLVERLQ